MRDFCTFIDYQIENEGEFLVPLMSIPVLNTQSISWRCKDIKQENISLLAQKSSLGF